VDLRELAEPPRSADLVIIGAGVVGAATAFHAARAGLDCILLERRPLPATLTTPRATGGFRLQFDNREEMELVSESVELFLGFNSTHGHDIGIRQQGYLWCTMDEAGIPRQQGLVEMQHGWGLTDVELLTGDETRSRFPWVGERVLQARFRQGDGFLDPRALALGMLSVSRTPFVAGCEVSEVVVDSGCVRGVRTNKGEVACEQVVIAAGPFSGTVAATAGLELPLYTVRRQKLIFANAPFVPQDSPMVIDEETGAHWRPALDGAFLLHTDADEPASPAADPVPVDHGLHRRLIDPDSPVSICRVTPFWERAWTDGSLEWDIVAGQYTMTPDHRPLIGPTDIEGLWLNCGYSGHGVMGSPACSRLLIDLICGQSPTGGNPLDPHREFVERDIASI